MRNFTIYKKIVVILLISISSSISAQQGNKQKYIIEYEKLATQKSLIQKGDKKAVEDYQKLIKQADKLLNIEGFSVLYKVGVPPSGNKHDYMSIAPYFWPNPDTPDGFPYIRKTAR